MNEPDEDVALTDRARAIVSAARRGDPSPEALAALRRKVVTPPRGGGQGRASALGGAALLAVATVTALFYAWPTEAPVTPPVAAPVAADMAEAVIAPPSVEVARPEPTAVVEVLPEASTEAPTEAPARAPIDEASYVESIRQALERQPARAVRLARRHPSLYPDGLLAEEAGALEAEGLARAGELEAARARADALYARFPSTPYRRRIERAIEEFRVPE